VRQLAEHPVGLRFVQEALVQTADDHLSRDLLLRLVADDLTWGAVCCEWEKLVVGRASWRALLQDWEDDGPDKLLQVLQSGYRLPFGAAREIIRLLRNHRQSAGMKNSH
jgi:hypothetical protein